MCGRWRHSRGEHTYAVGGLLARGSGGAGEPPVGAIAAVRLAVQAHLVKVQIVIVGDPGARGPSALGRLRLRGLHQDVAGARLTYIMRAGQDDGLPIEGAAHGAF